MKLLQCDLLPLGLGVVVGDLIGVLWAEINKQTRTSVSEGDWRISTHADPTSHERRSSNVTFTSAHLYGRMRVGVARALADSSDFEQSLQKFVILCLGCRWTAVQNFTPLALWSTTNPSPYKHTKTNKQKQTVNDISIPCLLACVDINIDSMRWRHSNLWSRYDLRVVACGVCRTVAS